MHITLIFIRRTVVHSNPFVSETTRAEVLQCPPRVPRSMYLKEFRHHCYEFVFDRAVKWPDAENDCNSKYGHLVSITSAEEQAFVYNNLRVRMYLLCYVQKTAIM